MEQDKIDAYMTLYTVLETFARTIAPFTPFIAESIYQNIVRSVDKNAPVSIHLMSYPVADESRIDEEMEADMDYVLRIVVLGRACRNAAAIKNRQPIGCLYVGGLNELPDSYADIVKGELNVKEVKLGAAASEYITYNVKPQMRTLGPKYGKLLGKIKKHLAEGDGMKMVEAVKDGGLYTFELDGTAIELAESDMLIEPVQKEGYAVESDGELAVIIDTELTPELIVEGYVREAVSKIQTMRKEAGFEVTDHISLTIDAEPELKSALEPYGAQIAREVLADRISFEAAAGYSKDWDINGKKAKMGVEKL